MLMQYSTYKKVIIVIGLVLLIFLGWLFKRTTLDRATLITVVGEGRVKIKPELVKFTITIQNTATSATVAIADNNRLARSLISVLKTSGVVEKDIQLAYVRVIPPQAALGQASYQAVNSAQATLRNISQFDNLVVQLYSQGATSISNILFTTENSRDLEKQAVTEAIKDAQSRAGELAKASGKWLGKMVSIATVEVGEAGALSGQATKASGIEGEVMASPSQIEIVRQASIVFELR